MSADLIIASLCVVFVCLLHARSLFWCNTKSKNVKKTAKREKKQIFFDVFASALLKRGKIWAPKIATKGHAGDQRTRRRPKDRTDTSLISLSLSLSLLCRYKNLFTVLLPGRKEDAESPVRRRRGESSLLRVSLGLRSRDGGVVSSERARGRRTQASSAQGRKTNKQRTRVKQKISKSANDVAFFSAQRAAEVILGDFWRRLCTKKLKGREQHETSLHY